VAKYFEKRLMYKKKLNFKSVFMMRKVNQTIVLLLLIAMVLASCGVNRQSNKCGCPPRRGIVG
jgi:hypothetical protein